VFGIRPVLALAKLEQRPISPLGEAYPPSLPHKAFFPFPPLAARLPIKEPRSPADPHFVARMRERRAPPPGACGFTRLDDPALPQGTPGPNRPGAFFFFFFPPQKKKTRGGVRKTVRFKCPDRPACVNWRSEGCNMGLTWKQFEGPNVDDEFPLEQLLASSEHGAVFLTQHGDFAAAEGGQSC